VTERVLHDKTILVVEDDYLIAEVLVELLESAGATVIGPHGLAQEALWVAMDTSQRIDAAVLDINLHGIVSYPIADVLIDRQIGIVFATGYDAGGVDEAYRHHAICTKPFNKNALLAALLAAFVPAAVTGSHPARG
jgi:CheY-like chemotaxis protein